MIFSPLPTISTIFIGENMEKFGEITGFLEVGDPLVFSDVPNSVSLGALQHSWDFHTSKIVKNSAKNSMLLDPKIPNDPIPSWFQMRSVGKNPANCPF